MVNKRLCNNVKYVFIELQSDVVRGCVFPWERIFLTMNKVKINYIDVYSFLFLSPFLPSVNNYLCGTKEI